MITKSASASDRRKYSRLDVDLPVKCISDGESEGYGRTLNASEGGLLVLFPEEMEIGQDLAMQLFFVLGCEVNILEATAKVVWRHAHSRNDRMMNYRTGVSFRNISPEDMTKLRSLLLTLSEDKTLLS